MLSRSCLAVLAVVLSAACVPAHAMVCMDKSMTLDEVVDTITDGGEFEYPGKDGSTFGNREGLLPRQNRGYYREYTVRTPGESDRGALRIVCGGQPVTNTAECYYTADHYATFRRIRP